MLKEVLTKVAMNTSSSSSTPSTLDLIGIMLLGLKVSGNTGLPWIIVTMPFWLPIAVPLLAGVLYLLIAVSLASFIWACEMLAKLFASGEPASEGDDPVALYRPGTGVDQ